MRTPPASSSSWPWCCRCWRPSIPPGAPRASIRSKRFATSEASPVQDATARPVLQLQMLSRTFRQGDREIPVLKGASADLYPGQAVALVGPSGAGKSTLLHIAGLLETPDGGRSEEHTSELQSRFDLVCRLLLEKKNLNNHQKLILNKV